MSELDKHHAHTLANASEFAATAQRMLNRYAASPENHLGVLYSAAEQLAQAAREVNRLIGAIEQQRR